MHWFDGSIDKGHGEIISCELDVSQFSWVHTRLKGCTQAFGLPRLAVDGQVLRVRLPLLLLRDPGLADVFISYAREDRTQVEKLAVGLESAGLSVWWDRNISGGAEFSQTIEQELNNAAHVIVAWSESSLTSHWVRDEAELARSQENSCRCLLMG